MGKFEQVRTGLARKRWAQGEEGVKKRESPRERLRKSTNSSDGKVVS